MNLNSVFKLLENKEKFRQKQVEKALFHDNDDTWKDATALPLALREELESASPIVFDFDIVKSVQGSNFKAAIKLEDGLSVETVLLRHEDGRNSVCVSSQAGCPMGCTFCRTASAGFARNLNVYEIVAQTLFFSYFLKRLNARITNVIFMGMGEPFLNYDNVMGAARVLNERHCFDIGARKISISTCGITQGIARLAEEKLQLNLAISLNAPDDNLRSKLMPVNNK
jgi:23S rRNA (adenine2503-C2)-methyltransferase